MQTCVFLCVDVFYGLMFLNFVICSFVVNLGPLGRGSNKNLKTFGNSLSPTSTTWGWIPQGGEYHSWCPLSSSTSTPWAVSPIKTGKHPGIPCNLHPQQLKTRDHSCGIHPPGSLATVCWPLHEIYNGHASLDRAALSACRLPGLQAINLGPKWALKNSKPPEQMLSER